MFTFRYLTVRQFRRVSPLFDDMQTARSTDAALDAMVQMLQVGLRGWRGVTSDDAEVLAEFGLSPDPAGAAVELPYRSDLIECTIRLGEMKDLCTAFMIEQGGGASDEVGNSSSPATSRQAQSAPTATEDAGISAKDSPRSTSTACPVPSVGGANPTSTNANPAVVAACG